MPQVDLPKGRMLRLDRWSLLGGALRVADCGAVVPNRVLGESLMGLEEKIGSLFPGKRADLVMLCT